jgi:hypothetical protein
LRLPHHYPSLKKITKNTEKLSQIANPALLHL